MSAGSSMTNPPEFMTQQKRRDLILAHLVFDVDGHSVATQNRLHSAADFMLNDSFDGIITLLDDEYVQDINGYLFDGKEAYKTFLALKLMTVNMIHLEDSIIRSKPDRDYDNLSDEVLKIIVEVHLRQQERDMLRNTAPIYPEGTGSSLNSITSFLKLRKYENELGTCSICLEDFKEAKYIAGSRYCEHEFHDECIINWLSHHRLCPLCKQPMLPAIAGYPDWVKNLGMVRKFLKRVY